MITLIGLAVGIDYSLFVIERYREERKTGRDKLDAITEAGGTASKAVLFSGLTVVFALLGLFLVPNSIFYSLGLGAVLVVIVAVCAVLTLIPAIALSPGQASSTGHANRTMTRRSSRPPRSPSMSTTRDSGGA